MSRVLVEHIRKLQLEEYPLLFHKASELFTRMQREAISMRSWRYAVTQVPICIQLACERLRIPFNETLATQISGTDTKSYRSCLNDVRRILGLEKGLTVQELVVQFGVPQEAAHFTELLLAEFKKRYGASLAPASAANNKWDSPQNLLTAFYLACGCIKGGSITKSRIVETKWITKTQLETNIDLFETYCMPIIAGIKEHTGTTRGSTPRTRAGTINSKAVAEEAENKSPVARLIHQFELKTRKTYEYSPNAARLALPVSAQSSLSLSAGGASRKRKLLDLPADEIGLQDPSPMPQLGLAVSVAKRARTSVADGQAQQQVMASATMGGRRRVAAPARSRLSRGAAVEAAKLSPLAAISRSCGTDNMEASARIKSASTGTGSNGNGNSSNNSRANSKGFVGRIGVFPMVCTSIP
ncbi:Origin of replication complex subunit 6 [Spiromyces aspiralis]|uniref:Origin of replication complex subunit 6 n=1 Tax=Spiromyces aspiralis TaxID=68401 RepID=A0ACC1HXD2_9FUNG|nr:Origin of replication complex subunit 6 [Spiromyces aspiralis]